MFRIESDKRALDTRELLALSRVNHPAISFFFEGAPIEEASEKSVEVLVRVDEAKEEDKAITDDIVVSCKDCLTVEPWYAPTLQVASPGVIAAREKWLPLSMITEPKLQTSPVSGVSYSPGRGIGVQDNSRPKDFFCAVDP